MAVFCSFPARVLSSMITPMFVVRFSATVVKLNDRITDTRKTEVNFEGEKEGILGLHVFGYCVMLNL